MEHRTISIADQVFEILEKDILTGVYARGELLTETKLSEKLGVSRTPHPRGHCAAWSRNGWWWHFARHARGGPGWARY